MQTEEDGDVVMKVPVEPAMQSAHDDTPSTSSPISLGTYSSSPPVSFLISAFSCLDMNMGSSSPYFSFMPDMPSIRSLDMNSSFDNIPRCNLQ